MTRGHPADPGGIFEWAMPERRRMRESILTLVAGGLVVTAVVAAQTPDATTRWREHLDRVMQPWADATLEKLVRFLPDATPWGLSPDSSAADVCKFKKGLDACNFFPQTVVNNQGHKYAALVVSQTWWFDDPARTKEAEDIQREKAALKRETDSALAEFDRLHGAEMRAAEEEWKVNTTRLQQQAADLIRQGKVPEGQAIIAQIKPFHYAPLDAVTVPLDARRQDLDRRQQDLPRRRNVQFNIFTNRTPSTTAPKVAGARPGGAIVGRTLYRNADPASAAGKFGEALVDLAVFVGPAGFTNPLVDLDKDEPVVKCLVVWAWIDSRPDTIQADEAAVRKVLEKVDYDGLSSLIDR